MLTSFRAKKSSLFFWFIIVLLIIGLAGFGISVGGIGGRNVARVGDRDISTEDFARAFDAERRAITERLGRPVTMAEARQYGIDRAVLARLVNEVALDEEAQRLGIATGDEFVARQIRGISAFQGLDGSFDAEAYRFALDRSGLSVREFETEVRREATRELVAASLQAPARLPDVAARTILDFLGEERAFSWVRLGPDQLEEPVPEPDEAELREFHAGNEELYTRPETREITYAMLTPAMLAAEIEITDEEVDEAYAADPDRFDTPERRFADRITFGTAAEAEAARARLDAGEITFDDLAAERELSPRDIDQGLLTASDLPAEAAEALFGAEGPGIVGPVTTPLGPSLYRLNGIIAGQTVPEEEARRRIREELAEAEAGRQIVGIARDLEDLVAGGATIEEIAAETPLEAGTLALNDDTTEGIGADPAFREAALDGTEGMETDPIELGSGGIAVLRVDAVLEPALLPFEEVRERVATDWTAAEIRARLTERAEALREEIGEAGLAEIAGSLGTELQEAGPLSRGESAENAPPELVAAIFELEPGDTRIIPDGDGVILARLDRIEAFDPRPEENAAALAAAAEELDRQFAADLLALTTQALQLEAGLSLDQSAIEATLSSMP